MSSVPPLRAIAGQQAVEFVASQKVPFTQSLDCVLTVHELTQPVPRALHAKSFAQGARPFGRHAPLLQELLVRMPPAQLDEPPQVVVAVG
jgi:hypothetical protein